MLAIATLLTTIILFTACKSEPAETVKKEEFHFNTICTIEIRDLPKDKADKAIVEAFKQCKEYDNLFSRTVEGSDIYKINHSNGKPVEVSNDTIEMLRFAIDTSKKSGGRFDISIGKLADLWNFTAENPKKPADNDILKLIPKVDYNNIKIEGNTVTLKDPDQWLDLGAVAKGFVADKLDKSLRKAGTNSALINLGGNLSTIGNAQPDKPWYIGIEKPYSDRKEAVGAVKLTDQTIVTSGVYERYFEENGVKYHHILDPKTGYPVKTDIVSISIISKAGNSMKCDTYATVGLLMGSEKAAEFLDKIDDIEYCIIKTNDGIIPSKGFKME